MKNPWFTIGAYSLFNSAHVADIILRGDGYIEVMLPNGSNAMIKLVPEEAESEFARVRNFLTLTSG